MNFGADHIMERIAAAKIAAYEQAFVANPGAHVIESTLIGFHENAGWRDERWLHWMKRDWYQRHRLPHVVLSPRSHDPDRKLRVGYVSSDFRHHSAAYQFARIIWQHDHTQVESFCYNLAKPEQSDEITTQFIRCADHWRECSGTSAEALALAIVSDNIDILVDLCGHCPGYALPVFTMQPAPIQISGFGSLSGTMVPEIGFLFSDPIVSTVGNVDGPEIINLPCALAYQPLPHAPDVAPPPRKVNGYPTFGYFGRLSKVSDAHLDLWCRAIREIPGARLVIKDRWIDEEGFADALRLRLAHFGMAHDSIDLRGRTLHIDHLAAHNDVDICLDSLPANGGMTTLEALWMGRPVVSLHDGSRLNGRVGRSILTAVGLPELSCDTEADFIAKCAELAQSKMRLPTRNLLKHSRIVDRVGERIEYHYRALWRRWCNGEIREVTA